MQYFKGDATEMKFDEAGKPAMDVCGVALSQYYNQAYDAETFLLMLYDEGRMPFGSKIPRDAFVSFIRQAIPNFPRTGTFQMLIFLIKEIFGEVTEVLFTVPAPGRLQIEINAAAVIEFNAIHHKVINGIEEVGNIVDADGNLLTFVGISGIDTEYDFNQVFSEIFPAGIVPEITLGFFTLYNWVADDGAGGLDQMVSHLGDNLVFYE
jgi:hypothetical protein